MGRAKGIATHFPVGTRGHLFAWLPRHGNALRNLLSEAWLEYARDYARYFAVAMVYYALVSLVPLLLLVLAAFGWLLRLSPMVADAERQVLAAVETGFGPELLAGVQQLLEWLRDQSLVASVVSAIGLAFTASVLVQQLRMSLRAIWRQAPPLLSGSLQAGVWQTIFQKAIAFVMILSAGLLLFAALTVIVAVQWIGNFVAGVLITPHLYPHDLAILIVPTAFAVKLYGAVVPARVILLLIAMGIYPLLALMSAHRLPPLLPVGFLLILGLCVRSVRQSGEDRGQMPNP